MATEEVRTLLKQIGLTATESTIYLCGLRYQGLSAGQLSKETAIGRTTVYHALETLEAKGLVSKYGSGTHLLFQMTPPEALERLIQQDIELLKEKVVKIKKLAPLFGEEKNQRPGATSVSQFEGASGMKLVVEEALYCKSRHWDIIAPGKNFFSDFDKAYADYFMRTRRQRGITTRSLWEKDPSRRLLTAEEIKQRNPRFLPAVMYGKFKTVIIIFDDKVALISSAKEKNALLLRSQEQSETFSALFNGLWTHAEKYPTRK